MSNVLIFDPDSVPVANRAKQYLPSVNTPDYQGLPNVLINPVMPEGIALQWIKVSGGVPVEMSQSEKDSIVAAEEAAAVALKESYYASMDNDFADFDPEGLPSMPRIFSWIESEMAGISNLSTAKEHMERFEKRLVKLLAWLWRNI